jgi:hypothetical protein
LKEPFQGSYLIAVELQGPTSGAASGAGAAGAASAAAVAVVVDAASPTEGAGVRP